MHTPGRCANTESCWIGNSGRTVRVVLGADFACPACHTPLLAPTPSGLAKLRGSRMAGFLLGTAIVLAGGTALLANRVPGTRALGPVLSPALTKVVAAASWPVTYVSDLLDPTPAPERPLPAGAAPGHKPASPAQDWHLLASIDRMLLPAAAPLAPEARRMTGAATPSPMPSTRGHWADGGRGWRVDGAPEAPARPEAPGADRQAAPAPEPAEAERTPLVVPSELAVVPPPKPELGSTMLASQPAEAVQPPALFGRGQDTEAEPPMAQLADLEPATAARIAQAEADSYLPDQRAGPGGRQFPPHRTALKDALRQALRADNEHVTLPASAAPALPRYPALFAQEYPAGRVSAVCLVAAAGAMPDCKVLGTGSSLAMTEQVGDWPVASHVHYRAIAANARRATAVWKPGARRS